ncbi:MAG: chemotaxis response regulator protein-glutamate methylesterase [Verrucomicrobia bacterium]|nr:chemotaxis response regulator protein-glutamate methylesterase [Verrucomicrobiota bacterium]
MDKIKVLLVDDSAVVREVLTSELSRDPQIQVVGAAHDAYAARDKIVSMAPDVVLLDIEMPRMDGLTFLRKLMHYHPVPVIIVSSLTMPGGQLALDAIGSGAVDVMCKPGPGLELSEMTEMLVAKIKAAAQVKFDRSPKHPSGSEADLTAPLTLAGPPRRIVAIGASTGGTHAIETILRRFPKNGPATLIVQHMPAYFTASFAQRLNKSCQMEVREAADGDAVRAGLALVARGNTHMLLRHHAGQLRVQVKDGPMVHHQRPSIEVLFQSMARCPGARFVAALLTGMGSDGAQGLLALRGQGAYTIAQDHATSVVFGMPAAAIRCGGACEVMPLHRIAESLLKHACNYAPAAK